VPSPSSRLNGQCRGHGLGRGATRRRCRGTIATPPTRARVDQARTQSRQKVQARVDTTSCGRMKEGRIFTPGTTALPRIHSWCRTMCKTAGRELHFNGENETKTSALREVELAIGANILAEAAPPKKRSCQRRRPPQTKTRWAIQAVTLGLLNRRTPRSPQNSAITTTCKPFTPKTSGAKVRRDAAPAASRARPGGRDTGTRHQTRCRPQRAASRSKHAVRTCCTSTGHKCHPSSG